MPKKFSLFVFAGAQVVMDLQPLIVILTGHGRRHGITHTLIGAASLGAVAAVSGKYLVDWVRSLRTKHPPVKLSWGMVLFSAWLGTFSHVLIDGLIYPDMDLFWPFAAGNPLRIGMTPRGMIRFCVVSGLAGMLAWGVAALVRKRREYEGD
ncbi:MAG: metal-dependent hydrolase [Chloroflexota bacterium]|nr:metal-dependent hydrolase [Chloroflexota bacterium]